MDVGCSLEENSLVYASYLILGHLGEQ